MTEKISKFDQKAENVYRRNFSKLRYRIFLFLESWYKKLIDDEDYRLEVILENIQEIKPKSILEIGSGTFPIYAFLPKFMRESCEYHICEVNPEKVQYIIKNYKNIEVSCSDALHLPYPNNFFDFVFSKGVLHHMDASDQNRRRQQRINFLFESKRVLKEGGKNLVMDFAYDPRNAKDLFWHFLHKLLLQEGEHNFSNTTETEKLFVSTSYKNIKWFEFDTFKGLYYSVIGEK